MGMLIISGKGIRTMESKGSCRLGGISLFIILGIFFSSCERGEKPAVKSAMPQDAVLAERTARDIAFRSSEDSPIPAENRNSFRGLDYYPVNDALKFSVQLNRYPRPDPVRLATNTGEIRSGLRYGYFDFEVESKACRLQVYRLEDVTVSGNPYLFIPFRDATSGQETYAPGRYIDLTENTSGLYDLDFNRAYNPFCAFNNHYSCPLPPAENILSVPVRAGEKKYVSDEKLNE
jgi:uncharacterized protein